ncbi:MAG: I78 family peptidase inhibitor [Variovorax sp.]
MKLSPLLLALLPFALIAGCASAPAPAPAAPSVVAAPPPPSAPQCNATGAQFAIGQAGTAQLEAAAAHRAGALTARSLRPGQATTMEFNGSRLNLELNAQGRVTAVRCG